MGFFSDLVLIAAMCRAVWELATHQLVPIGVFVLITVLVPYVLGATHWLHTQRIIFVLPLTGITVLHEAIALATLVAFAATLGQALVVGYTPLILVGAAMYVWGRIGGITWWAMLLAFAISTVTLLAYR